MDNVPARYREVMEDAVAELGNYKSLQTYVKMKIPVRTIDEVIFHTTRIFWWNCDSDCDFDCVSDCD